VADDDAIAGAFGHFDRVEGLGQGADLVDLDEDGVAGALADAALEESGVGDEEVVADELDAVADRGGQFGEAFPVVFVKGSSMERMGYFLQRVR
jgi:hypothetical protein